MRPVRLSVLGLSVVCILSAAGRAHAQGSGEGFLFRAPQGEVSIRGGFNHAAEIWWRGIENKLTRPQNLQVYRVPTEASQALAALAQRSMQLQATIQENTLTLGDGVNSIDVELLRWK